MGCHDVSELVQRLTRLAPASAARLHRAAKSVAVPESILGEPLPPVLPAMRAALVDGEVGLDGLLAVAGPLAGLGDRVGRELVLTADAVLAAEARGEGPDVTPPACADLSARCRRRRRRRCLDQDGAEPRGRPRSCAGAAPGSAPRETTGSSRSRVCCCPRSPPNTSASSTPSAHPASTLTRPGQFCSTDRLCSPARRRRDPHPRAAGRTTPLRPPCSSPPPAKLPTIGGAAPTLVVPHAPRTSSPAPAGRARRLRRAGRIAAARTPAARVSCSGSGRATTAGSSRSAPERVFNRRRRRAIALRDGGCIIPGCRVPAAWCESTMSSSTPRAGKPTPTTACCSAGSTTAPSSSGWEIRMNRGVPKSGPTLVRPRPATGATPPSPEPRLLDLVDVQY